MTWRDGAVIGRTPGLDGTRHSAARAAQSLAPEALQSCWSHEPSPSAADKRGSHDAPRERVEEETMTSKIENGPSDAVHKPHEDVAAEVCTDAGRLNDKELDDVAGGYLTYKMKNAMVTSYSIS
jgi:hypothetical protein